MFGVLALLLVGALVVVAQPTENYDDDNMMRNMPDSWGLNANGEIDANSAFISVSLDIPRRLLVLPNSTIAVAAGVLLRLLSDLELRNGVEIIVERGGRVDAGGLTVPAGTARINGTVSIDDGSWISVQRGATLVLGGEGEFTGRIDLAPTATLIIDGMRTIAANASITGRGQVILLQTAVLNLTNAVELRIEPDLLVYGGAQVFIEEGAHLLVYKGMCLAGSDADITTNGRYSDAGFVLLTQGMLTILHNFTLDAHYCSLEQGDGSGLLFLAPLQFMLLRDADIAASVIVSGPANDVMFEGETHIRGFLQLEGMSRVNVTGPLTVDEDVTVMASAWLILDPMNAQIRSVFAARNIEFRSGSRFVIALRDGWVDDDAPLAATDRLMFSGELLVFRHAPLTSLPRDFRFATYGSFVGQFVRVRYYDAEENAATQWSIAYNGADAVLIWIVPTTTTTVAPTTTTIYVAPTTTTTLAETTTVYVAPTTTTTLAETTTVYVAPTTTTLLAETTLAETTTIYVAPTESIIEPTLASTTTVYVAPTESVIEPTLASTTVLVVQPSVSKTPQDDGRIKFNFTAVVQLDDEAAASYAHLSAALIALAVAVMA